MKIEVLVTTMHQKDLSKYNEMNLQTNAIIANQADTNDNIIENINGKSVKFITTNTRGLSKNRNIAIENISKDTDYIIFADDDLKFYDGYEEKVISVLKKYPQADAVKFNLNCVSDRKIAMKAITKTEKVTRKDVTSWGVCALALKTSVLKDTQMHFNERFGTGTENYCGEDTIFLQQLFKNKLCVYASNEYIAEIDQSESTWFEGHNSKHFKVVGMILSEIYPVLCYPLVVRSAYKFYRRKVCDLSFFEILKCYYKGIKQNEAERKLMR